MLFCLATLYRFENLAIFRLPGIDFENLAFYWQKLMLAGSKTAWIARSYTLYII